MYILQAHIVYTCIKLSIFILNSLNENKTKSLDYPCDPTSPLPRINIKRGPTILSNV